MITQPRHKYSANPVFFNPYTQVTTRKKPLKDKQAIFFASGFEFEVYKQLVELAGLDNVKVQQPLLIKPASEIYPALQWKCDFRVVNPNNRKDYFNVEAKGFLTPEFKRNLQYLEFFSKPEFDKLIIVGNDKPLWIDKNTCTCTLHNAISYLASIFGENS